jgi:hypothetical protein
MNQQFADSSCQQCSGLQLTSMLRCKPSSIIGFDGFMLVTALVDAPAVESKSGGGGNGPDLWNRTYYPKLLDTKKENKPWYVIDAEGQTLGRLATLAADHIRCAAPRLCHVESFFLCSFF